MLVLCGPHETKAKVILLELYGTKMVDWEMKLFVLDGLTKEGNIVFLTAIALTMRDSKKLSHWCYQSLFSNCIFLR